MINILKRIPKFHLLILFTLPFIFLSCSKEGHVVIKLTNQHLENTPAGSWLSLFNIDYSPNADRIKNQVIDRLNVEGLLIDKHVHDDGANEVSVSLWNFKGKRFREEYYVGGIWEGPKIIPFQEYYNGGREGWITIEFENGIPYKELLPNDYKKIIQRSNREYEHTATIESTIDQGRRLFLFGYGSICNRISLF